MVYWPERETTKVAKAAFRRGFSAMDTAEEVNSIISEFYARIGGLTFIGADGEKIVLPPEAQERVNNALYGWAGPDGEVVCTVRQATSEDIKSFFDGR
jgi:hypothetical protein